MQQTIPCLCYNNQAEEAVNLYISAFDNSTVENIVYYDKTMVEELKRLSHQANPGPPGTVLSIDFSLCGQSFIAVNGGPHFEFTPATSFLVSCESEPELDRLFRELSAGGHVLMAPGSYGFSKKFSWITDKFGVSWQLNFADQPAAKKITPFLMFVREHFGKSKQAIEFYTKLLGDFQPYMAMDSESEHKFTFSDAVSQMIMCDTQKEVNELWEKFSEGGEKLSCGWIKDKFGVSWQVVPAVVREMVKDPDRKRSSRVHVAIFKMTKLELSELQKAYGAS